MKDLHQMNLDILTEKLKDPVKLINQLLGSEYAFALWSLPSDQSFTIAIDIHSDRLSNVALDEVESVFAINSFGDSHPPKPTYIRSDILITVSKHKDYDIKVDPTVSSSLIDDFFSRNNKRNSLKKAINSTCHFEGIVSKALTNINEGEFDKVVLSRFKDVPIPSSFDCFNFFKNLLTHYPNAFNYLTYTPEYGAWIGATPERLIEVDHLHGIFATDALAGTQPLEGRHLNDVAWTMKEIEEQAMVSRYIVDGFKKIRLREFDEIGPKTVKAGNLAHLKTQFRVDITKTNIHDLDKIMLDLLHPTSAVCGFPRTAALEFILKYENYDRALYSGFLGPVRFNQNTNLFVNLRCMQIMQDSIRLYAGAGITADSLPDKELDETEHKIDTLLSLLQKH